MTDKQRIDWLEKQQGCALVNDDNGHWACVFDGFQNCPSGDDPENIDSVFFIEKKYWKNSVREAIDSAMEED